MILRKIEVPAFTSRQDLKFLKSALFGRWGGQGLSSKASGHRDWRKCDHAIFILYQFDNTLWLLSCIGGVYENLIPVYETAYGTWAWCITVSTCWALLEVSWNFLLKLSIVILLVLWSTMMLSVLIWSLLSFYLVYRLCCNIFLLRKSCYVKYRMIKKKVVSFHIQ